MESTELLARRWFSDKAFEIELSRPQGFRFKAGHTIKLVYENIQRYYSLVSGPDDATLLLCLNHIKGGKLSPILSSAKIGTRFAFTGPHGYFNFSTSPRPPVFIGTDTGVSPFVSMARSGIKGFTLLQGARHSKELYYQELFRKMAAKYIPFVWGIPDDDIESSGMLHGKMVDLLTQHLQPGVYDFYLCGWQKMIRDVIYLADKQFPDSRVYTEVFYP